MREDVVQRNKALKRFWDDMFKRTIIFFGLGLLISALIVLYWKLEYSAIYPLIVFLICFGVSWTLSFRKHRLKRELEEGDQ